MTAVFAHALPVVDGGGVLTYKGRVCRWECDRNHHWNVRFYARAFQMASEVLALAATGRSPGAASAAVRHFRFHRELGRDAAMVIHSARIAGGAHDGGIVHVMRNADDGGLAATALDAPGYDAGMVPAVPWDRLPQDLTRGIEPGAHGGAVTAGDGAPDFGGIVHPEEVDHTGGLLAHAVVAHVSAASQGLLNRIGFTPDWITRANRNRMAVEMKVTTFQAAALGDLLRVSARVTDVRRRVFTTDFQLRDAFTGDIVAVVEQLLVTVDLGTRRAVPVPAFVQAALEQDMARAARS